MKKRAIIALSLISLIIPVGSAKAAGLSVDDTCRINGPGRTAAINHLWAYKSKWDWASANLILNDISTFKTVCTSPYYHMGTINKTGKVVVSCFAEWTGYDLVNGSCYAPWDGNAINPYNAALLVSSA